LGCRVRRVSWGTRKEKPKTGGLKPPYNGDIHDDEWTSLPETIVAAGPPLKERPSKGELRDLLAESLTL